MNLSSLYSKLFADNQHATAATITFGNLVFEIVCASFQMFIFNENECEFEREKRGEEVTASVATSNK